MVGMFHSRRASEPSPWQSRRAKIAVLALVAAAFLIAGFASLLIWVPVMALRSVEAGFAEVRESHVVRNVPAPEDFDSFLTRDLDSYFAERTGKTVAVTYELLRDGPSQSGVAYPKYYAWVSVHADGGVLEEGVVRVAAIDQAYFEVTHYFSAGQMRQDPSCFYAVFADDVRQKIETKLGMAK
jgi:hypothetical protein